ncbi:DNA alkylation repair protein [Massilia sp. Dwa41.01b]|uniref:DNA alkylation repair protein n=1 Tax=unclassified Massilia TaxID=2609279 RepID=UPI001601FB69|nr:MULTISPECIES: DNA alkylation repair protein [unclassified Massilia]QNA87915.1 DNA alkylation repair protein [Massilia sp. Dwa41.01b]QNA98818.1 DNA alkylation repair protein [Massilia sp. Se16.2.3]
MSDVIVAELECALRAAASEELAQSLQRYFPTPVTALGVSNACVTGIAAQAFARHRTLSADDWLALAEHFARSQAYHEHLMLASALVAKLAPRLDDEGRLLERVQAWLENAVGNWAQCDDLCIKPLHAYLKRHPHLVERIYPWGQSSSPWCRRASNVALVKFVGRSAHVDLDCVFANCARLLADRDPYVQKGIGWVLKVAGKYEPGLVVAFLRQHLASMERATVRYAIENLPADVQRTFMHA